MHVLSLLGSVVDLKNSAFRITACLVGPIENFKEVHFPDFFVFVDSKELYFSDSSFLSIEIQRSSSFHKA